MTMTSPLPLRFSTDTDPDGAAVLHVRGEVDLATAGQLRERLLAEFARHPRLVVDLSHAMLYDGAALRALHALHREAVRQHRLPPALRGVRPLLAKALRVTGMNALFPIEPHAPFQRSVTRAPLTRLPNPASATPVVQAA